MKKEYKIPYYAFSFSKRYYLLHPWVFFKDIGIAIKNASMRLKYCWDWPALWNMDGFMGQLIPNMLDTLADRACGWNDRMWPTFEDYQAELRVLAKMFKLANMPTLLDEEISAYDTAFFNYCDGDMLDPIKHLPCYSKYKFTQEDCDKVNETDGPTCVKREQEQDIILRKALAQFTEMWSHGALWD